MVNFDVVLIPASKLKKRDRFLWHRPTTENERVLKEKILRVIDSGIEDFWCPNMAPAFTLGKEKPFFAPGEKTCQFHNAQWWLRAAYTFAPECGSRLGTESEYVAFLGVLMKELVASGKRVAWVWNAVCNDSKELGHYHNSVDTTSSSEPTGSRPVWKMYDLANTRKLVVGDDKKPVLCGGGWHEDGDMRPLSCISKMDQVDYYVSVLGATGWIVFQSKWKPKV